MKTFFRSVLISSVLLLVWQLSVDGMRIPDYLLPAPTQIAAIFISNASLIVQHTKTTLLETSLGFGLGIIFGCFAGFMIALFRPLRVWCWPLLIISQAIPTFAIAPILVIWLGYGLSAKVATTILMIFFPITSAFYDGLQRTPQEWLDLAQSMHANRWRVFWFIRIPAALPSLASGIRIAAVAAPIGAIVGEWVGSSSGLGYLMLNANARVQIDMMFAALIVIIALALILYFTMDKILRSLVTWES